MNRNARICAALSGIVLGAVLASVLNYRISGVEADSPHAKNSGREEKTVLNQSARAVPPIDQAASAKTETATFALG